MFNNLYSANNPTFPVQDKFGQTIIQFGASKIEQAMIQIASGMVANPNIYNGQLDPETIADESFAIVYACFEKIDEEYKKHVASKAESSLWSPSEWPETKL